MKATKTKCPNKTGHFSIGYTDKAGRTTTPEGVPMSVSPDTSHTPDTPDTPDSSGSAHRRDRLGLAVLLLILVTAVPAAVLVLPNTASYVVPLAARDLGLSGA